MPTIYQRLGRLQYEQEAHDDANHKDVWGPGRQFAVRHYMFHFLKYGGRLVRKNEPKPIEATLVDSLLVSLSAANMLGQNLGEARAIEPLEKDAPGQYLLWADDFRQGFADFYGLDSEDQKYPIGSEEAKQAMRDANWRLVGWVLQEALAREVDVLALVPERRKQLRARKASARALASSMAPNPDTNVPGFDDIPGR